MPNFFLRQSFGTKKFPPNVESWYKVNIANILVWLRPGTYYKTGLPFKFFKCLIHLTWLRDFSKNFRFFHAQAEERAGGGWRSTVSVRSVVRID